MSEQQRLAAGPLDALYERLAAGERTLGLTDAIAAATAAAISEHMCPHCAGKLWPAGEAAYCQDCHTNWHPPIPPATLWSAEIGTVGALTPLWAR